VQRAQHAGGARLVHGGRADRVTREAGQRRGGGALPADVADDEAPGAARQREHVVRSRRHLVARGAVERGDVEPGHIGQLRRKQGALERARDAAAVAVEPCVVRGDRGAAGQLGGELDVLGVVTGAGTR